MVKIKKKYVGIIVLILLITVITIQFQKNESDKPIQKLTFTRDVSIPDNIILWDEKYPLTLDDFQGTIGGSNADDQAVAAQSNIGFWTPYFEVEVMINGICQYKIKNYEALAKFDKSKSWIRLEKVKQFNIGVEVLNHEQRHFDIVEIYSRIVIKLINDEFRNKEFPCLDVDPTSLESSIIQDASKRILPLESIINGKYQKSQEVYDQEAGDRKFFEQQKKWNTKIDECLDLDLNKINQCVDLYSR